MSVTRQLVLAQRPKGLVNESTCRLLEIPSPAPAIDPTIRTWMDDAPGYLPAIELGGVIRSGGIGEVIESNNDAMPVGSKVFGMTGWQDHCIADRGFQVIPEGVDALLAINVMGVTGMTGYFGVVDVLKVQAGDVVVVSGAAGATGSIAGQVAKSLGARVIGIAGGPEKCALLTEQVGFDAAIDYRAGSVAQQIRELAPKGIDAYFDNVGGEILEACLANLKMIALCGAISTYNATQAPLGPSNYAMLIVKRAIMQGFLVLDYAPRFGEAQGALLELLLAGKLWHAEHLVSGLEAAPEALNLLFTGGNTGKLVVTL
ncbi:MAG: NADP-dependent oxidoreductase [Actinobacteria bacterium]|nr:NADP-dependent oxidoreductase [Actinomycetota bacterium]